MDWSTTSVIGQPPNYTDKFTASAADFPDDIREVGDSIAALTLLEARELVDYLSDVHKINFELGV